MNAKVSGPYSAKVRDHFSHPRNAGTIHNPSGTGLAKSPVDSDTVLITLRITNNHIEDIRFKCMGCAAAIACSSVASELAKGKRVDEAYQLTKQAVAEALNGIPEYKMIFSNLASDAIRNAIDDWRSRQRTEEESAGS
jgi:nitrogen fixation NifU-like protein